MADRDSAAELEQMIERYNDAWNAQDLDTIVSLHAPGMVFENHTAGERAEADEVREPHRGDLRELARPRASPGDASTRATGLVVSEWTATATAPDGRRLTWDGVDVFPCEDGRIVRKDVYSAAHRARTLDG